MTSILQIVGDQGTRRNEMRVDHLFKRGQATGPQIKDKFLNSEAA